MPITQSPLSVQQSRDMVLNVMTPGQREEFEKTHECQFAISAQGVGRFRVSCFYQRNCVGMVLRRIESKIPTIEELNLPPVIKQLAMTKRGIIIFVGAHRHRQIDFVGRDDRLSQPELDRPHHHHRGPDRVRAQARGLHHHPARSRHRHRQLGQRAEEHAAPGARRDHDRRSAHARDDGARDQLLRNRPLVLVHAAREQREPGDGPHPALLPGGSPLSSC